MADYLLAESYRLRTFRDYHDQMLSNEKYRRAANDRIKFHQSELTERTFGNRRSASFRNTRLRVA